MEINPNLELLSIIFRLSRPLWYNDYNPNNNRVSDLDYPYLKDVDDYFAKYKDSKAVKMATELSNKGFNGRTMVLLASYMDTHNKELLQEITSNTNASEAEINAFINAVLEFSKESNFKAFYTNHTSFYQDIVKGFAQQNPDIASILPAAEAFFHTKLKPVRILLEPSMMYYYEALAVNASESKEIYIAEGITGVIHGKPFFSTGRGSGGVNAPGTIAWLISYPFFNKAFSPYASNISEYEGLYDSVKEVMKLWGVPNLQAMILQTASAAFVTYYLNFTYGSESANKYMWVYTTGGLYFLPEFVKVTSEYMNNPNEEFDMLVSKMMQRVREVYIKTNGGKDLSKVIPTPTVLDFTRQAKKTGVKIFYNPAALNAARMAGSLMNYVGVENYTFHTITNVTSSDLKGNIILIVSSDDLLYKLIEKQLLVTFNGSTVYSKVTGKTYHGPTMFAEILKNPWDPNGLLYIEVTQDWTVTSPVPVRYLMHYVISQGHNILETR